MSEAALWRGSRWARQAPGVRDNLTSLTWKATSFSDPFSLTTYLVMSCGSCGSRRGAGSPPVTPQSPKSQGPASPGAVCPPQPQPLRGLRRPKHFSRLSSELTKDPSSRSLLAPDDSESPGSLHSGPFKHHRNAAVTKTRPLSGIQ